MINKIELMESNNNFEKSLIKVDLVNKNVAQIKDDSVIKNYILNVDSKQLEELTKKYITYWENQYTDNTIIGGIEAELIIYTNEETLKFSFKNMYPYNYNEFIKLLKEMVGIV